MDCSILFAVKWNGMPTNVELIIQGNPEIMNSEEWFTLWCPMSSYQNNHHHPLCGKLSMSKKLSASLLLLWLLLLLLLLLMLLAWNPAENRSCWAFFFQKHTWCSGFSFGEYPVWNLHDKGNYIGGINFHASCHLPNATQVVIAVIANLLWYGSFGITDQFILVIWRGLSVIVSCGAIFCRLFFNSQLVRFECCISHFLHVECFTIATQSQKILILFLRLFPIIVDLISLFIIVLWEQK